MICDKCLAKLPRTGFASMVANPMVRVLWREMHITHACSYIYYNKERCFQQLIYDFKYRGMWRTAYQLGLRMGEELKASPLYADIDVVVPVPLHPFKTMERGYNQSEYLARGVAKVLGVECETRALRRIRHNPSQTTLATQERRANVDNLFRVVRPKRLNGKHILLIDDVMTSGATISSCGKAVLDGTFDTRLSVATLAFAGDEEQKRAATPTEAAKASSSTSPTETATQTTPTNTLE